MSIGINVSSARHIFRLFGEKVLYTSLATGIPAQPLAVIDKQRLQTRAGESFTNEEFVEVRFLVDEVADPQKGDTIAIGIDTLYTVQDQTYNDGVVVGVSVT